MLDLRLAIRSLRATPIVTVVALATLALCIGANTAIFSFINGLLLAPLPYPHADRLVSLWERTPSGRRTARVSPSAGMGTQTIISPRAKQNVR